MGGEHILIKKAFVYKNKPQNIVDKGYLFDNLLGYWVKKDNGKPAIYDPKFSAPRTKKADEETGEDQKGR